LAGNAYKLTSMQTDLGAIKKKAIGILRKHNVKRAAFFGSFARGEQTVTSDVDILVEFEGTKSLFDLVALQLDLQDELGTHVDVLTYNSLLPAIRESVLEEQVLIL
jgi:uncharacterized protein